MIINGDARRLPLADESLQCVVASPPYFGLRDYGVDGQIGLERSPEEYIATLVAVFREVRRVLRSDGTLWLNIGDSYAGSGQGWSHSKKQGSNTGAIQYGSDNLLVDRRRTFRHAKRMASSPKT
jgi:DNA modification methylase